MAGTTAHRVRTAIVLAVFVSVPGAPLVGALAGASDDVDAAVATPAAPLLGGVGAAIAANDAAGALAAALPLVAPKVAHDAAYADDYAWQFALLQNPVANPGFSHEDSVLAVPGWWDDAGFPNSGDDAIENGALRVRGTVSQYPGTTTTNPNDALPDAPDAQTPVSPYNGFGSLSIRILEGSVDVMLQYATLDGEYLTLRWNDIGPSSPMPLTLANANAAPTPPAGLTLEQLFAQSQWMGIQLAADGASALVDDVVLDGVAYGDPLAHVEWDDPAPDGTGVHDLDNDNSVEDLDDEINGVFGAQTARDLGEFRNFHDGVSVLIAGERRMDKSVSDVAGLATDGSYDVTVAFVRYTPSGPVAFTPPAGSRVQLWSANPTNQNGAAPELEILGTWAEGDATASVVHDGLELVAASFPGVAIADAVLDGTTFLGATFFTTPAAYSNYNDNLDDVHWGFASLEKLASAASPVADALDATPRAFAALVADPDQRDGFAASLEFDGAIVTPAGALVAPDGGMITVRACTYRSLDGVTYSAYPGTFGLAFVQGDPGAALDDAYRTSIDTSPTGCGALSFDARLLPRAGGEAPANAWDVLLVDNYVSPSRTSHYYPAKNALVALGTDASLLAADALDGKASAVKSAVPVVILSTTGPVGFHVQFAFDPPLADELTTQFSTSGDVTVVATLYDAQGEERCFPDGEARLIAASVTNPGMQITLNTNSADCGVATFVLDGGYLNAPSDMFVGWRIVVEAPGDQIVGQLHASSAFNSAAQKAFATSPQLADLLDTTPSTIFTPIIAGDLDGDGLENELEAFFGTRADDSDTDGDGASDFEETTAGLDGRWTSPVAVAAGWTTGSAPFTATDDDGDGHTNLAETQATADPANWRSTPSDHDGDGIPTQVDIVCKKVTSLSLFDTDADGLTDAEELAFGTNIGSASTNCIKAADGSDSDGDGLLDSEEIRTYQTNPLVDDTDRDGTEDGAEVSAGTDPRGAYTLAYIRDAPGAFVAPHVRVPDAVGSVFSPTTSIAAPANGAVLTDDQNFTVRTQDVGSGAWRVLLDIERVGGGPTAAIECASTGEDTWNCPWTLPPNAAATDGSYTAVALAYDRAGNPSDGTGILVTVDRIAPTIEVRLDGGVLGSAGWYTGTPTLAFTPGDATSGVETVECRIDDGPLQNGTTSVVEGTHTYTCRATDHAGHFSEDSVDAKLDLTNPALSATPRVGDGANGWHLTRPDVTIDASDTPSGLASVACTIEMGATVVACGAIDHQTLPASVTIPFDGAGILVRATAADVAGRTTTVLTDTIDVDTVDPAAPTISLTPGTPSGIAPWYTAAVTVGATSSDATSGVDSVECRIGAGAWQDAPITVGEGVHTVECRATDVAGNVGPSSFVEVKVDPTDPEGLIEVSPPDGTNGWHKTAPTATLSAMDETSGVDRIDWTVRSGGTATRSGTGATPQAVVLVENGATITIEARSFNEAGLRDDDATGSLKIDTVPPTLVGPAVSTTAGPSGWHAATPTVTVTGTDVTSGVDRTQCRNQGGAWGASAVVPDGADRVVECRVTDFAGHEVTASVTLDVDTTRPAVAASVSPAIPDGASGWYKSAPVLAYSATDAPSGVATLACEVLRNGVVESTCPASGSPLLAQGTGISVRVTATDAAGHANSTTIGPFKIDTVKPAVLAITPSTTANAQGWHTSATSASATGFDATSGVARSECSLNGTTWTGAVALRDGTAVLVRCRAVDNAGLVSNEATATFKVDTTPPTYSYAISPASGDGTDGWYVNRPTITYGFEDATSTLATTTCSVFERGVPLVACPASGFALPGEGVDVGVVLYARDAAGHETTYNAPRVKLDLANPSVTVSLAPASPTGLAGWYVTPPTVNAAATDATSDIHSTSCTVDGTTNSTLGSSHSVVLGEGVHTVSCDTKDQAGRLSAAVTRTDIKVDLTGPTTTPTASPSTPDGTNGYYVSNVAIGATATDATSGVASIACVAYDQGDNVVKSGSPGLTLDASGVYRVECRATDVAGNLGPIASAGTFILDLGIPAEPVLSRVTVVESDPGTSDRIVGSAGAAEASATVTAYHEDGTELGSVTVGEDGSFAMDIGDNSVDSIVLQTTDPAGWSSTRTPAGALLNDVVAPTVPENLAVASAPGGRLVVSWDAADATRPDGAIRHYHVHYRCDAPGVEDHETDVTTTSWTSPPLTDGATCYISVQAEDAAGNEGGLTSEVSAIADATAPVTKATPPTHPAGGWTNRDETLALLAVDPKAPAAGTGLAGTFYTLDGGAPEIYDAPVTIVEGETVVSYWSKDQAGNVESPSEVTFRVDTTAPRTIATGVASPPPIGWHTSPVVVALACADDRGAAENSTCDGILYGIDGPATLPYQGPVTMPEGVHRLNFRSRDHAGNLEAQRTIGPVSVDTVRPSLEAGSDLVGALGVPVRFAPRVTDPYAGEKQGSGLLSVTVDFGDGTTASVDFATPDGGVLAIDHVYATYGVYEVTFTAQDVAGAAAGLPPIVDGLDVVVQPMGVHVVDGKGNHVGYWQPNEDGTFEGPFTGVVLNSTTPEVLLVIQGLDNGAAANAGDGAGWGACFVDAVDDDDDLATCLGSDPSSKIVLNVVLGNWDQGTELDDGDPNTVSATPVPFLAVGAEELAAALALKSAILADPAVHTADWDGDGDSNSAEILAGGIGCSPFLTGVFGPSPVDASSNTRDRDGDGLNDDFENDIGTDRCNPDTDFDGLRDGDERVYGTDPTIPDADHDADGVPTYVDIAPTDATRPQSDVDARVEQEGSTVVIHTSDGDIVIPSASVSGTTVTIASPLNPSIPIVRITLSPFSISYATGVLPSGSAAATASVVPGGQLGIASVTVTVTDGTGLGLVESHYVRIRSVTLGSLLGDAQNPDGDGLSTAEEIAICSDPTQPNPSGPQPDCAGVVAAEAAEAEATAIALAREILVYDDVDAGTQGA